MSGEEIEITPKVTADRIKKYLDQGKRFDGRKLGEFRELKIEKDISKKAEGSVRVRLGKTDVIVGIKMGVSEPYPDSPDNGNLMVTAELLPMSSSRIELGPPKFNAIELGRVIDRGIRESKFIELDKLCIKKGEKVWTVFVDIYSINDDGNLFDAAGIGAVTALKIAKIPEYDEKEEKVIYEKREKNLPLRKINPFAITVHKIGNNLIVDPTKEEEDVSETRLTIGSSDGTIYSMQKGDSTSIKIEEISKAIDLVEKMWKELFKKVEEQLK
ncbi:MAG: exosome complex protein Rrp42 [Candidatus Diapherotrites archaeon]